MKNDFNSAKRLHSILLQAKEQREDWSVQRVWASVFQIDENDLPKIFYQLALLQELTNEVEKEIRNLDVDHDVYLQHMARIRQALAHPNFQSHWGAVKQHLTEAALLSLQFCAESLKRHSAEIVVPEDELRIIQKDIDELFQQIADGDFNKKLKTVLLDMLEAMRRAINEYRIRGAKGLREELFTVLERFQRNFDLIREHKDEPVVGAFWQVLTKYDTLTSVYVNAPQIIAGFQKMLPGIAS
jgi:uncharacterized protein with HEPN domain